MVFRSIRMAAQLLPGLAGLLLIWLPLQGLTAQRSLPGAEYYSLDDGLSDRLVNDLVQDAQGFIWIGTPNGLNRFDGYEFLTFNNHRENPFSISATNVQRLSLAEQGRLLIQYKNNKVFFDLLDPRTNELTKVRLFPNEGIEGYIRTLYVNPAGKIHVVSIQNQNREGTFVYRYRPGATPQFERLFRIPEVHSSISPAIHLVQLSDNSFLINDSELGLRLLSPNGALLKVFKTDDFDCLDGAAKYPNQASFLHQDRKGTVWLSLAQVPGVFRYNAEQQYFEQVAGLPAGRFFPRIWEDQQGNVLLSEMENSYDPPSRLYCLRPDGSLFDFSHFSASDTPLRTVFSTDFFKTIVLGLHSGISIVKNNHSKIQTFLAESLSPYQRGSGVGGMAADGSGTVYFTHEDRFWYSLDRNTGFIDTLNVSDAATGQPADLSACLALHYNKEDNSLWGIANSPEGEGRLHHLDLSSCLVKTYSFRHSFAAFTPSRDGRLWLACESANAEKGALVTFDPHTERFGIYLDKMGKNPLRNSSPNCIVEGKDQALWIGTDNGLYRLDRRRGQIQTFRIDTDDRSVSLSSNTIYTILQDPSGELLLGTNNGLNILDPATRRTRTFDQRNGLANNFVVGLLPAGEPGNYWISTHNGLSYFDQRSKRFRNFYAQDGLSDDQFNRFSCLRDESGRYYFGSVNGLNAFYSEDLLFDDPPPPVVLTRLTRFNSRQDSLITECIPACNPGEIVISPYDIYFQLHFMLPSFYRSRKNQFAAWLEGYEKDWIYLGNTPNIRYSKLPPGRYTLHVNGAGPNGNWSAHAISIQIRVRPVFYRTWWFILLGAAALVAASLGWMKYRLEQKLKVERLRMKLSSDIHDEVSGLLSGIAMQTDVLQESASDELSRSRLRTIGEKSRKAMSKMSDVIWSIDSRNDRVQDLLLRMSEHAEEILTPAGIHYTFHVKRLDRQIKMPVKIRQELYFIFKETINNIAKHSNAGRVEIFLGNNGSQFEMTVHDNGKAKNKSNGKTGQGLSNIRMRAQRIDAQLEIVNREGYTVQLKMKKFA